MDGAALVVPAAVDGAPTDSAAPTGLAPVDGAPVDGAPVVSDAAPSLFIRCMDLLWMMELEIPMMLLED